MSRTQKKCLIASLFTHGTLLLSMIIGSAFITPQPKPIQPTIELVDIPDILIDENFVGGGNPTPVQPPQQQPPAQKLPEPEVEKRPPPVEVKKPDPKPVVVEKRPEPKPEVIKPNPKPAPKPQIKVNTRAVEVAVNNTPTKPTPAPPKINAEAIGQQLSQAIESKATGATAVSIPGVGGASYAPYAAYLKKVYEMRWIPPQTASGNPVVQVQVVVAKNGEVLSAKITKPSGNRTMDRSIQTVLDQIRQLRPLPESTTDSKRTFNIQFNLF